MYEEQWALGHDGYDYMNIQKAWSRGLSGKNVTICIIDDGLDHRHPDLRERYRPELSFDFNDLDDIDHDPSPDTRNAKYSHGTKCAGVAAAEANNGVCGVGVAFGASIAGFRLLDGRVNSLLESRALSYLNPLIDIKSLSWGPVDNGKTMEKPTAMASKAIEFGVKRGRHGRGTIFVWATGNGGARDHCGADGYTSNPNIFTITSVDQLGWHESYDEAGSSILAATYAGQGISKTKKRHYGVCTTGGADTCVFDFKGTSAAAPIAAGIFALLLESNPELTYRDVMHIVVETARVPLTPDNLWTVNGAGYYVHDYIGFGTLDADAMIELGAKWTHVSDRKECNKFETVSAEKRRTDEDVVVVRWLLKIAECEVERLEHFIVTLTLNTNSRGGTRISVTSPAGTLSVLLDYRPEDHSDKGIHEHPFGTNRCWGENPEGIWVLEVSLMGKNGKGPETEEIKINQLKVYGT
ncbi:hypothetical protein ACOME3_008404 [Neoechinorhynchus agilis]